MRTVWGSGHGSRGVLVRVVPGRTGVDLPSASTTLSSAVTSQGRRPCFRWATCSTLLVVPRRRVLRPSPTPGWWRRATWSTLPVVPRHRVLRPSPTPGWWLAAEPRGLSDLFYLVACRSTMLRVVRCYLRTPVSDYKL